MLRLFLSVVLMAAASGSAWAQAISVSDARYGGTACSSSVAYGDARAVATATANGGQAFANQISEGRYGGFADGRSMANTINGSSTANGRSTANGPRSYAQNTTVASSFYGSAVSNGSAYADPFGQARSETVALSDFGRAVADGHSYATYGSADGYTLSHSFGPLTYSRSISQAQGMHGGPAYSDSTSVGIGSYMPVQAMSEARSYAIPGSVAQSQAAHFNDGYRY